jgi:hypothetical protein
MNLGEGRGGAFFPSRVFLLYLGYGAFGGKNGFPFSPFVIVIIISSYLSHLHAQSYKAMKLVQPCH